MRTTLFALSLTLLVACNEDDAGERPQNHDAGSLEAGVRLDGSLTGDAGGDAAAPYVPLDPRLIPSAFTPYEKARCGELGESCTFLDGSNCEGSLCSLDAELCLPEPKAGAILWFGCSPGSCAPEAPYCITDNCLTLEEASCVCGAAGGSKKPVCAAPAVAALGAQKGEDGAVCLPRGARCDGPFACCNGLSCEAGADGFSVCVAPCVQDGTACSNNPCCGADSRCLQFSAFGDTEPECYDGCTAHSDCASGCCSNGSDPQGGSCVAESVCFPNGCQAEGETCGDSAPCCGQLGCITSGDAQTGTCRPLCGKNADCASGCCKFFGGSTTEGSCYDALACTCLAPKEPCGGSSSRDCCAGSSCVMFEGQSAQCHVNCTNDGDCGGECCRPLSTGGGTCGPCS